MYVFPSLTINIHLPQTISRKTPGSGLSSAKELVKEDNKGHQDGAPQDGECNCLQGGPVIAALAAGAVVEIHVVIAHEVQYHLRSLGECQIADLKTVLHILQGSFNQPKQ